MIPRQFLSLLKYTEPELGIQVSADVPAANGARSSADTSLTV